MGAHRRCWMPFRPAFSMADERFVENMSSCRKNSLHYYFIELNKTPQQRLRPTIADGLPRVGLGRFIESMPQGGQLAHHGDDVCGGVVSVLDGIPVLFLPYKYKTYSAGDFRSRPNPNRGTLLMRTKVCHVSGKTTLLTHFSYRARG